MSNKLRMFGVAILMLTLVTAAILAMMVSPANPFSWLVVASLVLVPMLHQRLKKRQYFVWKPEYSVGIDSIDTQHRKLVSLINNLQTAIDYSAGEQFEREALDALVDYTRTHFGYEEDLMQKHCYPSFEPHRAEHHRMIANVETVLESYREDPDAAMQEANSFLKNWLIKHINGTDKQYSQFLIGKGVK